MTKSDLDILRALTEDDVRHLLSGRVYKRAKGYYRGRRVRNPRRVGAALEAHVHGTQLYDVRVEVLDGDILPWCTCPYAELSTCKHVGAVLLQWIREPESFLSGKKVAGFASAEGEEQPTVAMQVAGPSPPQKPSPLSSPTWWYEQLTAVPSSSAESSEAGLGLQALLERLKLSQLRDIARQRDWRVQGSNKADYIAALAPLLGNPGEVARAVTSLPDGLREALRAVSVAEDGGGITPVALAHVMSALGGDAASPLKPVVAAGLLLDLARWGLVIPWRDFRDGHLRYLFLWEVQRHAPPLPGWCRQLPQPPSAQVPSTDGHDFVQLLYSVWERILQEPLALRPSPEPLPEERFVTGSRGWRYDPQERKAWLASSRRRTDTALTTLSLLPPAFLLDDAGLSAVAPFTDGDVEQLEFVCRLLCDLDLVTAEKGYLLARPETMTRFLCRSTAGQCAVLAQAYMSLRDWSELDTLLRADTRLILRRTMKAFFEYHQLRSQLAHLRHMLLRFLATAGEEGWCALADVEVALRALWPRFSDALAVDDQQWVTNTWWLAWRKGQRELSPDDTQGWRLAQGSFLRIMLEGPLRWLGFAELCRQDGELVAFRLRGLADLVWDRPAAVEQEQPPSEAVVVDEQTLILTVHPGAVPPQAHTLLGRIARLEESAPGRFVYRLDMRATHAAFKRGETLPELLAAWAEIMPLPVPEAVRQTLSFWWARYGQVRLYEGLALLQLTDDLTLRELEASTSLSQYITARLSPCLVLVSDEAVDALLREFTAKGYTPKEAN